MAARPLIGILLLLPFIALTQPRAARPVKTAKPVQHATQEQKDKSHPTRFAVGAGITRSVLFLARNTKANNDAYGYNLQAIYTISQLMRLTTEFTRYFPINIAPTWYNVRAFTVESNMHFITRFQDSETYFYPMLGISYNVFEGFFTGQNDFLNLRSVYPMQKTVISRWGGFNAGLGFEQFFNHFSVFGEFKMRVGISEGYNDLTILDVCYSAGLRYTIHTHPLHKIYRGTRSRYMLHKHHSEK
jgi:hypothetical protein